MRITESGGASAVLAAGEWMLYEIAGRTTMHAIMRFDEIHRPLAFWLDAYYSGAKVDIRHKSTL
jgi:hypothetical protein